MADRRGRGGRPFERLKAQVKAESSHCAKCGKPLYPDLKWPHRWSTSIDHIIPLHLGGEPLDPANVQATHLTCNVREGNHIRNKGRKKPRPLPDRYTNDNW